MKKTNIIAGIDYSITCPTIAVYNTAKNNFSFNNVDFYFNQHEISTKEYDRRKKINLSNVYQNYNYKINDDTHRFLLLADWCISIIKLNNVDVVALESYSLSSKGKVFNIAEATGLLKTFLFINNIQFHLFPPTVVKKCFSEKGNSNKQAMINVFNNKNNINISQLFFDKETDVSPVSDIVDSYAILETFLLTNSIK